ncbi:MAG: hypothetical protein ABIR47_16255 [Candidatus Kapaibacterium sp.]
MMDVSRGMLAKLRGLIDWRGKITEDGSGNVYVRDRDNAIYRISRALFDKLNPAVREKIQLRLFISRFLRKPV